MKSILLTSSKSSSNNISLSSVGSHNHRKINSNRHDIGGVDDDNDGDDGSGVSVTETVDKEQYNNNNKLLSHSNNIKKQVIRNKIIAKNDDKLKRVSSSSSSCGSDNNKNNSEDQRWLKNNKNTISDNNISGGNSVNKNESLSSDLENYPLIDNNVILNESDSNQKTSTTATTKLINLRKKNGTTLIFQRKNCSQTKQATVAGSNEYQELEIESFKKRQSLQWPYSVVSNRFDSKNRHYSWYDSRYPHAIEEEFENSPLTQFANEDNNLAEIKTIAASSVLNISSDDHNNVPDSKMKTSIDGSITSSTGATSKRWRIEQFLKNLVGKRSSTSQHSSTSTITNTATSERIIKSPSAYDLLQQKPSRCESTSSLNKDRLINKSTASLNSTSLALVHQKLWSVVPLLNRRDGGGGGASCNNLLTSINGNVSSSHYRDGKMRKCETVLALTDEEFPSTSSTTYRNHSKSINNLLEVPMRPLNRLRNSQSCYVNCEQNGLSNHQQCSRCSSLLSLAAIGGSNYSLTNGAFVLKNSKKLSTIKRNSSLIDDDLLKPMVVDENCSSEHNLIDNDFNTIEPYTSIKLPLVKGKTAAIASTTSKFTCKLCLGEFFSEDKLTTISSCGCIFCTECMRAYVEFEISEGAYELSCPDALCNSQGVVSLTEISQLASESLVAKHHRYRLNREVELDKYRLWCPNRNCETICSVIPNDKLSPSTSSQSAIQQPSSSTATLLLPRSVLCPTCNLEFCSSCKKAWHQSITCEENSKRLGSRNDSMMLFDNDIIKNCPMCAVPIEKDEGCAQMMCKRCKHVFCWYCLASLDDDFLLRHYDKGPCKNKLGHSRASVVWHRAQVIGIFAGFGILLLVASPLLLLAAPCIVCCKCKIEESTTAANKLDEQPDHSDHQV